MKILQINNCHYRRGGADVVYLNTGELLESKGNEVFYFSTKNKNNNNTKFENFFVESVDFINMSLFKKMVNFLRFFYRIYEILYFYKSVYLHVLFLQLLLLHYVLNSL